MGAGRHSTPSKGFSTLLFANCQHSSPCTEPSTLTQNEPVSAMSCQRVELTIGRNPTSGGSSETDVNEPIVKPTGVPSALVAVMMVTPVGKWPST